MVDDLQNLRLVQPGHRLGHLVVVHQHHTLAPGAQQVVAAQRAHHTLVLVQNGVAAVAGLQHHLPHVIDVVIQVEADNVVGEAGPGDGDGLVNQPVDPGGVQGRGDDAGLAGVLQPLRVDVRLAEDEAGHAHLQRPAHHIRLVAADHDGLPAAEEQVVAALGQGDGHGAADGVGGLAAVVEDAALQHADQVKKGHVFHPGVGDGVHAIRGDVAGGQHAVQRAVGVGDGDAADVLLADDVPGPVHGDGGVQGGGRVIVQVPHLGADVFDQAGRLYAEIVQDALGLVADLAQPHRHIVPVAHGVAQRRVGQGGHDGVRVRVAVTGNVDLVHRVILLLRYFVPPFIIPPGVELSTRELLFCTDQPEKRKNHRFSPLHRARLSL